MQRRSLAGSLMVALALTACSAGERQPELAPVAAASDEPTKTEFEPAKEVEPEPVSEEPEPAPDEPEPDVVSLPGPITAEDVLGASWEHSCAASPTRPLEPITLLESGASVLGLPATTGDVGLVMLVDESPEAQGDVTGDGGDEYVFRTTCVENGTHASAHYATFEVWTAGSDGHPLQLPSLLANDWRAEGFVVSAVLAVDGGLEATFDWVGEPGPPITRRYPWDAGSGDWGEWEPVGPTPGM